MANNGYLERQAIKQQILTSWVCQAMIDAMILVLNDPEVMWKDRFGEKRLEKVVYAVEEKFKEVAPGFSRKTNASYVRAMVDRELAKICGEKFAPWEERYELWDDKGI